MTIAMTPGTIASTSAALEFLAGNPTLNANSPLDKSIPDELIFLSLRMIQELAYLPRTSWLKDHGRYLLEISKTKYGSIC